MIVHENIKIKMADESVDVDGTFEGEGIANAVIVTNLNPDFFDSVQQKEEFESAFRTVDNQATFNYLKSFRRARVNVSSLEITLQTRNMFHNTTLCGQVIKCYFAQLPRQGADDHLHPPKPEKMFLISPPCSPPVGWEQNREADPVVNFDLVQALQRLTPDTLRRPTDGGEESVSHELHPPTESMPSIVVHVCEDPEGYATRPALIQTTCPKRN